MQFRIQCGSHYNALHFKGVIIYRRSHNSPVNNDSPSHYLPGKSDGRVIINCCTSNKTVKYFSAKCIHDTFPSCAKKVKKLWVAKYSWWKYLKGLNHIRWTKFLEPF